MLSIHAASDAATVRLEHDGVFIETRAARFEIDASLSLRAARWTGKDWQSLSVTGTPFIGIEIDGEPALGFRIDPARSSMHPIESAFGRGCRVEIVASGATATGATIEAYLRVETFDDFPQSLHGLARFEVSGTGPKAKVTSLTGARMTLGNRSPPSQTDISALWILQGGSYANRPDWILPLHAGFTAANEMRQRFAEHEVGGGLPALDVWGPNGGVLIGSLSKVANPLSLPARVIDGNRVEIGIEWCAKPATAGHANQTGPFLITVHGGDFFDGLRTYAATMARQGIAMLSPPDAAYEPVWCSWGFGPDFSLSQLREMLPIVRQLGFGVVTIDAGWFAYNGDYFPRTDTFPQGATELRALVDDIHAHGLQAKLWLTTAVAGKELAAQHPEWLLCDSEQRPIGFTFGEGLAPDRGQFLPYLCPAVPAVLDYYRELTRRIVGEWNFDGFKMDQNFINGIPECHAPGHAHDSPYASIAALADIDRVIHEEATRLKPGAILEVCPCGAFPDFYKLPFYNQPVSSDFNTAWQIRHRGKIIKALMGANAAYYGDHFERRYSEENLPSMIGVGGIPGSMAVLREADNADFLRMKYPSTLTPARREELAKWLHIYRRTYLSKGEYVNLYDLAHDRPETHTVRKDGKLYYAFFAEDWTGEIELRGLEPDRRYVITDYEHNRRIACLRGGEPLQVSFTGHLLVVAAPVESTLEPSP